MSANTEEKVVLR